MQWSRERTVLLSLAGLALLASVFLASPSVSNPLDERPSDPEALVGIDSGETRIRPGEARIWPYVSATRSFEDPRSSINVVFRGDADRIERYLRRETAFASNGTEAAWTGRNATDPGLFETSLVPWTDAPGAPRYTYVATSGRADSGTWLRESYQLHRGNYFGEQYHLRVYESPGSRNWTAIQAHSEHWDWFTITHTVDSLEGARQRVEAEFMGEPFVRGVSRVHYDNADTYDADGWTTVIELAALVPGLALVAVSTGELRELVPTDTRRNRHRVGLFASLVAVVLGVRAGGVLFERHLSQVPATTVVAILYPALVVGVPACAYAFGRRLEGVEAAALASLGFGTGVLLDYAVLTISVLPVGIVVHRTVATVAVSTVAAAATADESLGRNHTLLAGLALWTATVAVAHLG